jgi:hypothetical protein
MSIEKLKLLTDSSVLLLQQSGQLYLKFLNCIIPAALSITSCSHVSETHLSYTAGWLLEVTAAAKLLKSKRLFWIF